MYFNNTKSSAWRKVALAALVASACISAGCSSTQKGMNEMNVEKIDAQALATLIQNSEKVDKIEHSWGWLRWLMNDKIDPKAEMTFGLVQIDAGGENPLHTHPNCEEILYMLSGSCDHIIGDQTVTLKAGQVIRIPRGVPHRAKTAGSEPMKAVIVYSSGDRQFVVVKKQS